MDQTDTKREALRELEQQFQNAKGVLLALGKEKEDAFNQMREYSTKLKSLNQQLDSLKGERDELSKKVRSAKAERSTLNQKVKDSSKLLKSAFRFVKKNNMIIRKECLNLIIIYNLKYF